MPFGKHTGGYTSGTPRGCLNLLPRWAWLMVIGFALFVIQVHTPDLVDEFINGLLQNPNSLSFTGAVPLLKVSLVIWNISGIALFVFGIVDLVLKRRRS